MKHYFMMLARVFHTEKYWVVIAAITLISGVYSFGIMGVLFTDYSFREFLSMLVDNQYHIITSVLGFIFFGLLLRLDSKYYKPYVIINGEVYIPTIKEHSGPYNLKSFESKCFTCTWKPKCKAGSDYIMDCDYYQEMGENLRSVLETIRINKLNRRKNSRFNIIFIKINTIIPKIAMWLFFVIILGLIGSVISGVLSLLSVDENIWGPISGVSLIAFGLPLGIEFLLGIFYLIIKNIIKIPSENKTD